MRNITSIAIGLILIIISGQAFADLSPSGFSLSYGQGQPNHLSGYRLGTQWNWNIDWLASTPVKLEGYWDASVARWLTDGDVRGNYKSVWSVAFAPVFRLQPRALLSSPIVPYLEIGSGPAWLSTANLGTRNVGSHWIFQDIMGLGIRFGNKQQFDLSYRYLHYSNAGLAPANCGIDVKALITFAYRWS